MEVEVVVVDNKHRGPLAVVVVVAMVLVAVGTSGRGRGVHGQVAQLDLELVCTVLGLLHQSAFALGAQLLGQLALKKARHPL